MPRVCGLVIWRCGRTVIEKEAHRSERLQNISTLRARAALASSSTSTSDVPAPTKAVRDIPAVDSPAPVREPTSAIARGVRAQEVGTSSGPVLDAPTSPKNVHDGGLPPGSVQSGPAPSPALEEGNKLGGGGDVRTTPCADEYFLPASSRGAVGSTPEAPRGRCEGCKRGV